MANREMFRNLRAKDGDTLPHLLSRGTLGERKRDFKKSMSKEEYDILKQIIATIKEGNASTAVTLLVQKGCDINAKNDEDETPLDILCDQDHLGRTISNSIRKNKKSPIACNEETLLLLEALIDARANTSHRNRKQVVKASYQILLHNQSVIGKSWLPSQEEIQKTPLMAFKNAGRVVLTEVCQLLVYRICRSRETLPPWLILRVLCVYLSLIYTNVLRGNLLLYLLQHIGLRFDDDPNFACMLLFGDKDPEDTNDKEVLYALDQAISTLAGAKGCDAIRYRCPTIGTTPLHLAVVLGLKDMVTFFMQHPLAKLNVLDDEGNTPLMAGLHILKHSRVWSTNRLGVYLGIALELASDKLQNCDIEDQLGSTPLLYCVEAMSALGSQYRDHRLYQLISRDPNCKIHSMLPIYPSQTAAMLCITAGLIQALFSIISHQSQPDLTEQDMYGRTALHFCGLYGQKECAELLIEICPSLCNISDNKGNTPLFYLVETLQGEQALQLLTKFANHWDLAKRNSVNQTALDFYQEVVQKSKRDRNLEKALINFAEVAQFRDSFHQSTTSSLERVGSKLSRGSLRKSLSKILRAPTGYTMSNYQNRNGSMQSMQLQTNVGNWPAAPFGYDHPVGKSLRNHVTDIKAFRDLFRIISSKTTKVNAQNASKRTALMICAENGLSEETSYIITNMNPDINQTDAHGMTALHLAAVKNQVECTHILLSAHTINMNIQDNLGNSPIFYIVEKFQPKEAVKILGGSGKFNWDLNIRNNFDQTAYEYYMEKLTQRHLNEQLANVLARRCIPPLPRLVPERSSTGTLTRGYLGDRLLSGAAQGGGAFSDYGSNADLQSLNQKWRVVLKKYRIFFMENFDSHPIFYSYLIQTGDMDSYTSSKIQSRGSPDLDKAAEIFDYISRKDENAFRNFLAALRKSSQGHIADELEGALEEDVTDSVFVEPVQH